MNPEFAMWVGKCNDSRHLQCKVCRLGNINCSNADVEILKTHMKGNENFKGNTIYGVKMEYFLKSNKTKNAFVFS